MKRFTKTNISDIPKEHAHGGSGSRQLLVKSKQLTSPYFEAMTKGFLEPGGVFEWHIHENVDEFFLVIKGEGKFYWQDEVVDYRIGDIITIPANTKHKIEALGKTTNEYYFVRIKSK